MMAKFIHIFRMHQGIIFHKSLLEVITTVWGISNRAVDKITKLLTALFLLPQSVYKVWDLYDNNSVWERERIVVIY